MAYAKNMRAAAARHFRDAETLFGSNKYDNAGYHYGLSAECALKGAMERAGLKVDEVIVVGRRAYFVHFPELKRIPVQFAGRISQTIATVLYRTDFLQEWEIRMRYSPDRGVSEKTCNKWRDQVRTFNNSCGGI